MAAIVACLFLAFVDLPGVLSLGPLSMSGLMTIFLPMLLIAILVLDMLYMSGWTNASNFAQSYVQHTQRVPLLLWLFVFYALVRMIIAPDVEAIQNVLCYVLFVAAIATAATSLRRDYSRVARAMYVSGLLGALFFVAQVASQSPEWMGARSFAMTGLITLCLLVPGATGRSAAETPDGSRAFALSLLAALFVFAAIMISLSRSAFAVAVVVVLFLATRAPAKRRVGALLGLVLSVTTFVLLVALFYPPMVERFTVGDNATVAGINMNTSGRSVLWQITWTSAWDSPVWGHGPGHSGQLVEAYFGHTGIGHPHNDYLRIFNDLGLVGLLLFWGGVFQLTARCIRRTLRLGRREDWMALSALMSMIFLAATDNIIVYNFAMTPIGVLIGMCLRDELTATGSPSLRSPSSRSTEVTGDRGADTNR